MRKNFNGIVIASLILMLALSGCNLGAQAPDDSVLGAAEVSEIDETSEVATEAPTETPVVHVLVPGELPEEQSGLAGDQDSSTTAAEKRAPAGDRFTLGRYERPFNTDTMDVYYPSLDIQVTEVYQDDTWVYGVILLKDEGSGCSLTGKYGFEIDWNVDGGGDLLMLVSAPASADWSTAGVEVWYDENDDVGGAEKSKTDASSSVKNGYETQWFGAGLGDDPDLAWARISPDDSCALQLALKVGALQGNKRYLIGMWAGTSLMDPALFDHNDAFTHEQAGSSLIEFEFFYPVKQVYELDNVCRMAVGFQPTGGEPGVCPPPPGPEDAPPPPPGQGCPPPSILYCSRNGCYCLYPEG